MPFHQAFYLVRPVVPPFCAALCLCLCWDGMHAFPAALCASSGRPAGACRWRACDACFSSPAHIPARTAHHTTPCPHPHPHHIPHPPAPVQVVTTLTTVGFGDVVAKSLLGKAVVIATICIGVVVIPVQAAQLYAEFAARRVVRGGFASRALLCWAAPWSAGGLRRGDACCVLPTGASWSACESMASHPWLAPPLQAPSPRATGARRWCCCPPA